MAQLCHKLFCYSPTTAVFYSLRFKSAHVLYLATLLNSQHGEILQVIKPFFLISQRRVKGRKFDHLKLKQTE